LHYAAGAAIFGTGIDLRRRRPMSDIDVKPDTIAKPKIEQPRLYKVILINDDYTPREFVISVLMMVFHMSEDQAYRIMMTAHQRGACVVAAFTRDIAESKATEGTNAGRQNGHPLEFTTEPEE
jgi:ATP-dependent Clp protease adaptor protein ClpS